MLADIDPQRCRGDPLRMTDPEIATTWMRRHWPLLVARWAVFSLVLGGIALATGTGLGTSAVLGVVGGAVLNAAWCWVA